MDKLSEIISKNIRLLFPLIFLMWSIRFYEYASIELIGDLPPKYSYFLSGLLLDLFLALCLFGVSVIMQKGLDFIKFRWNIIFMLISLLFLFFELTLIHYFNIAKIPLDETILFFSWEELKMIGDRGGKLPLSVYFSYILLTGFYFILVWIIPKFSIKKRGSIVLFAISLTGLIFHTFLFYESEKKVAEVYVNNRAVYFVAKIYSFSNKVQAMQSEKLLEVSSFKKLDTNVYAAKSFDPDFPLLHKLEGKSEFARFFKKSKKGPPSIVFIIVEALSADFIGENAGKTGNAMPFLDSLSKKSLFFPNFLSVCQNTFNVLPASVCSVPNSSDGEYTMMNEFVPQFSLPILLENYYSRFFCGVDLGFTNMDGYMTNVQTDYLVDDWDSRYKVPFSKNQNMWGYPDGFLFDKTWDDFKKQKLSNKPRFDVILTISTHEPYSFPEDEKYASINKNRSVNKNITKRNRQQLYSNKYLMASYTYLDDALKKYFEKAKKHGQFENTIFFIYGDHGCPSYAKDAITRFNVPLVVYSPLLKEAGEFKGVSTQLDLAPTILNYLRLEYKMNIPEIVPFIGKELDFYRPFRSNRSVALLSVNGKNESFLQGNYFYSNGTLYKLQGGLNLVESKDSAKKNYMREQLANYDLFSRYSFHQNKIIPEELFNKFSKTFDYRVLYSNFNRSDLKSKNEVGLCPLLRIKPSTKSLKITSEMEWYFSSKKDFDEISNQLVVSLLNINNGNKEHVFWRKITMVLPDHFKPNTYNRVRIRGEINLKNMGKVRKRNELSLYILNEQKNVLRLRNVKTIIYAAEK